MSKISERFKARIRKSMERERFLERPMETFSRILWPYSESKLIILVSAMPVLDVASTFAAIRLSGKHIREAGLIGKWALQTVGYPGMFVIETTCIGLLVIFALGAKSMYARLGFSGFGRAACVFLLAPTLVAILAAVLNNIILTLM